MFPEIDKNGSFPDRERAISAFWKEHNIYEQSLAARENAPPFVFFEGPPTANGMPHPGHCLTRAIKDLFPRYRTMRGYRCERKAGWDTHGLPVEVEVCKELGIHSKEEIEAYGVEPFIQKCQQSVWRYIGEWQKLTDRMGFWVDMDEAYVTYHQNYVESVWWSLKELFDRGLLYQGHKIVWWWAQGGTALSAGEVGQGYREVADPSVYVKFPIVVDERATELGFDDKTSLLVWTTTPWTLPSNQFAAVHPELKYERIVDPTDSNETIIVASDLARQIIEKVEGKGKTAKQYLSKSTHTGQDLIRLRYKPPFEEYYSLTGSKQGVLVNEENSLFDMLARLSFSSRGFGPELTERLFDDHKRTTNEFKKEYVAWRVVPAGFVTTESGSGIVHQAPAFGEVDYALLLSEKGLFETVDGPDLINAVDPNGKFTDEGPEYCRGRWVKDCDKDIIRDLKERGLLFLREQYLHDYPFCWRAEEDPLIQYPRESWFIRTTEYKDQMLANNAKINWLPEHIKTGRFGKFLESNVDWALSRERYWGTPLPIWVCAACSKQTAVGSFDEVLSKSGITGTEVWAEAKAANPELPDDLQVHKPYIDAIEFDCDCGNGKMQRVPEVIDCWYDSGAMPFAQWGYRGQADGVAREKFRSQFPADFISEALDQTRGWFYSQVAISTLLFGKESEGGGQRSESPNSDVSYPHPFKNCIVLGLMLGEDGQKMSKSKRNYRTPDEIFDAYGADALRWYFFANQPPWTSIRYSEQAIKDSIPEFLLRLWNVYSFFTIYANIDEFAPEAGDGDSVLAMCSDAESYRTLDERSELDRWILSELNSTCATVVGCMDEYDNYGACQAITAFVDALSNWYVRRSRDRFWAADKQDPSKLDAYWTLYECLLTTTRLIAPFVPFVAETLWQNLVVALFGDKAPQSVHLCDYPTGVAEGVDEALSERMTLVRHISSLGRQARNDAQLKVRQPLAEVIVVLADQTHQQWLEEHAAVIAEELNVKQLVFSDEPEKYVQHEVLPNFKLLGPRLGKLMGKIKPALAKQSGAELLANIRDNGQINLTVDGQEVALTEEEVEIRLQAREGWAAANAHGVVAILATELTEELIGEGLARDLVRVIQDVRKDMDCQFTDRIEVGIVTESSEVAQAAEKFNAYLAEETLAVSISLQKINGVEPIEVKVGGFDVAIYVRVTS